MKQAKIVLKSITKEYQTEVGSLTAIGNLDLAVFENEILCLVGPSGCGKTTLINLIAGFVRPTVGEVLIDGKAVTGTSGRCGVVFQADSVFPWMTVQENIAYGLRFNGTSRLSRSSIVRRYAELVGLASFAAKWPKELSGGMKKRVDLARAYAFNPEILLLDEPFGSLDVQTKEEMQILLLQIWREESKTVVFVTHDVEEAVFLGHRVVVMTPRPGAVKALIEVPFSMPRDANLKLRPTFVELRKRVVEDLIAGGGGTAVFVDHTNHEAKD